MRKVSERKIHIPPMGVWAMRDLGRKSGRSILVFVALLTLVWVVATPLLLTKTLVRSSESLLEKGPSLVIRRVTTGGWATLPVKESMDRIRPVPGVMDVRSRVWGLSTIQGSPVTLVGVEPGAKWDVGVGKAIAGMGTGLQQGEMVELGVGEKLSVTVTALLDQSTSTVGHDVLLLHVDDCRGALGIPEGGASDLVVDVFHESEEKAILHDLAAALPWPVQIVTRGEMLGLYRGSLSRRGGIGLLLTIPALFSLLLLVVSVLKQGADSRKEMGILKGMGWTSGDIATFHLWKTALLGVPAVLLGSCMAYAMIFTPAVRWVAVLFLGWQGHGPHFVFSSVESLSLLAMVSSLVFLPFLASVMGPVLLSSTTDPVELIRRD